MVARWALLGVTAGLAIFLLGAFSGDRLDRATPSPPEFGGPRPPRPLAPLSASREVRRPGPGEIVLVDEGTLGYYNESLGTVLDGTEEVFLPGERTGPEPRFRPAPEPRLTAAAKYLGPWLKENPLPLGPHWSEPRAIPQSWKTNTETAIVYPLDVPGPNPLQVVGDFSVDNGLFVWVGGKYQFGSIEPVGTHVQADLGTLPPGRHFVQVLRVDHGVVTGYRVRITGRTVPSTRGGDRAVEPPRSESPALPEPTMPPPEPARKPGRISSPPTARPTAEEVETLLQETRRLKEAVDRLNQNVEELRRRLERPQPAPG